MKALSSFQKPRGQSASDGGGGRRRVTVCRVLCRNVAWTVVGLTLVVAAGETWRRVLTSFAESSIPTPFVHDVGRMLKPDTKIYYANSLDSWTISRTNGLGFLDRESPSAERTADSFHAAIIGDSSVEAKEVPIADKAQVQLENLSAQRLPRLDVTTSAYSFSATVL